MLILNTESKYSKYMVNKRLRQDAGFSVVTYVPERTHNIILIMHHTTPSVKDNHKWTYMLSLTHNLDTYIFNQAKLNSEPYAVPRAVTGTESYWRTH